MSYCPRLESDGLMRADEDAHAELGLADLLPHAAVLRVIQTHAAVLNRNLMVEFSSRFYLSNILTY